jgi:hypothetical protein
MSDETPCAQYVRVVETIVMVNNAETEEKFGVLNRQSDMKSRDSKADVLDSIWCLRRKLLDRQRALEGRACVGDRDTGRSFIRSLPFEKSSSSKCQWPMLM